MSLVRLNAINPIRSEQSTDHISAGCSTSSHSYTLRVTEQEAGLRLDKYLASRLPDLSRSQLQRLIHAGQVHTSHGRPTASTRVRCEETITVHIPPPHPARPAAEAIPLHILYEDDDLLVINKAPGMVVHPAPGHYTGTLVNALLHHCRTLSGIGGERRPGIVHRLDKDTSGALLIAKNDRSHRRLSEQLKSRQLRRDYLAFVRGQLPALQGVIDAPIGRHPKNRKKMAVVAPGGRSARTHYESITTWGPISLLKLRLESGRTHQIRVHLEHVKHPVIGDPIYGSTNWRLSGQPLLERALQNFPRQALHAERVCFQHPTSGVWLAFHAPVPDDMRHLLTLLRQVFGDIDDIE
jgi:23S rRNA pseudouridine1911/1915/1917 synthase